MFIDSLSHTSRSYRSAMYPGVGIYKHAAPPEPADAPLGA